MKNPDHKYYYKGNYENEKIELPDYSVEKSGKIKRITT
tara:strand:+ start:629 stop:742 length:114 start_codon:yes stop_codon:yes gene_type:complete